ncbi:MAG TPA: peroxiredoxin [Acidimicrobiia bacterium]|nr:peroxiredoxin [Acidimicrobiia bacterium]
MDTGDLAPDFELATDDGSMLKLSDELAKGPVVLFFYPKAMTSGCTKESCHFRDLASEFEAVGGRRLGISADSVEKQHKFSEKHSFDYPLLSDPDKVVAKQFGVKRSLVPVSKRATFVIDTDRRVLAVINSESNMDKHADDALEVLRKRKAAAG